jgi:selenium metabolism protein YedF
MQIDCRGLSCPEPVLRTKKALEQIEEVVEVLVDNEAARQNIERLGHSQGCVVTCDVRDGGCFLLRISRVSSVVAEKDVVSQISPSVTGKHIYVFSADSMGRGSTELGWALLQTYVKTILELKPLPAKIIFYNAGVRLACKSGKALEALQTMQSRGVEILVCGTCLDYYKLLGQLRVGRVSNMFDICSAMVEASKVLSPL